jgi:hypothetical protein
MSAYGELPLGLMPAGYGAEALFETWMSVPAGMPEKSQVSVAERSALGL